ncbi:MAG: histidine--tRNA ligase [Candidatus Omnitrophota bacterium]
MEKKFIVPRGTKDILPSDIPVWERIENIARMFFKIYGYREIRTPIFEETGLFKRSLGQTSDVVTKQLLNLASQNEEGFSLRPEGTASIVRSYIENSLDKKESLSKLYYIGAMFRGERPQKGRLRQFHQIGVEAIGPDSCSPFLDAEVICLSVHLLESFGVKDFILKINTLGTLEDKSRFAELLTEKLKSKLSGLCEECQGRFSKNVFRVLDCKNRGCQTVVQDLACGQDWLSKESREYFLAVKAILTSLGIAYVESPGLVRGLDYYTSTVFEISSPSLGSQDALGAGGRYDDLVSQLGGSSADAVGFSLGIERILLALSEDKDLSPAYLDAFFVALDEESFKSAFRLLNNLRKRKIACDISFRYAASMKSQMRLADKSGARYVLILGEDELRNGVVTLKNMAEGIQSKEKIEDLDKIISTLKGKVI